MTVGAGGTIASASAGANGGAGTGSSVLYNGKLFYAGGSGGGSGGGNGRAGGGGGSAGTQDGNSAVDTASAGVGGSNVVGSVYWWYSIGGLNGGTGGASPTSGTFSPLLTNRAYNTPVQE